ncbi:MAG: RnfABCDGE type electron transport complex subunit D [Candidatus Thorarchaeota archaeon]
MNNDKVSPVEYQDVAPPHMHLGFTKAELMFKTFGALSIIAIASIIVMGLNALIHIVVAMGTVLLVHGVIYFYEKWRGRRPTYQSPSSPMVAGMIVGLAMPIASPFLVTAGVALITMLLFKYGQGRYFKRKYLNPAAASKVLLLVFLSLMFFLENSLETGILFHPHHLELDLLNAEGFLSSMWIFSGKVLPVLNIELTAAQGLVIWQTHGWIGGACGLVVFIVGAISTYWLKLKWRIIVSTLVTMTALAIITGLVVGSDPVLRVAFHVFTGSVIFMTFFMATEPQSTPMPEISQILFGVILAVLTFVLQLLNVLGGSIIALLVLNLATPYLDKVGIKTPYGLRNTDGAK